MTSRRDPKGEGYQRFCADPKIKDVTKFYGIHKELNTYQILQTDSNISIGHETTKAFALKLFINFHYEKSL
jgi:hypothetical protein